MPAAAIIVAISRTTARPGGTARVPAPDHLGFEGRPDRTGPPRPLRRRTRQEHIVSQPASGATTETDAAAEQHASPRQESDGAPPASGRSLPGGVVLVVNPTKVGDLDELTDLIAAGCAPLGLPAPQVLATSKEDPGKGQAEQAVRSG